jgi:hypothetical protein
MMRFALISSTGMTGSVLPKKQEDEKRGGKTTDFVDKKLHERQNALFGSLFPEDIDAVPENLL